MTDRGGGRGRLHSASLDDVVTFAQRSSNAYGGTVAGSGLISHSPNERDYIVEVPPPPTPARIAIGSPAWLSRRGDDSGVGKLLNAMRA